MPRGVGALLICLRVFYLLISNNYLSLTPRTIQAPALRSDDEDMQEDGNAQAAAEAVAAKPRHKVRYAEQKNYLMQAFLQAVLQLLSLQAPPRKRQKLQEFSQPAPAPGALKGAWRFPGPRPFAPSNGKPLRS